MANGRVASVAETLGWHYRNRHAAALNARCSGQSIIGVTSNTVPRELIAAAGMFPLLLSPPDDADGTGAAPHDAFMEPVFDSRTCAIFDFLVSGKGEFLRSVIIPRTSEREHKLFLYLKEIERQEHPKGLAGIYLYNLLHTRSDEASAYSLERTVELKGHLESLAGREICQASLKEAILAGNAARQAARKLVQFREGPDARLTGSEALELLGARYFMDAAEYARLAMAAAREIERRTPCRSPRILLKGCPLHLTALHREIESHGVVVFAEDDWWGSRSASPDIAVNGDPLEAIVEHYYSNETSPRVHPLEIDDGWFHERAELADGVVFYLPPHDELMGWDYPRHRRYLDERRVPHLLVRSDAAEVAPGNGGVRGGVTRQQIASFAATVRSTWERLNHG